MGGKWSKNVGWPTIRERMRRTAPRASSRGGGSSISRPGKTWSTHK
nr:truncated nef protein [Human immunodeficiency virus 1]